jgi:beta-lactamase class A
MTSRHAQLRPYFVPILLSLLPLALPAAEPKAAVDQKMLKEADTVPGKHAFLVTELIDKGPVPLYAHNPRERFAVGSSFKLYILGALIDEVNAGRRRLDNTTLLSKDLIGPPSSELAEWPIGSPVTLHTLALKMIWISDNTATDHLLYLLGRTRVEAQMKEMGHSDPAVNRPLLSTREMVMLRDKKAASRAAKYQKLDEAGRREFLQAEIAGLHDYQATDFDAAAFDVAEWYASPLDMAHDLDWIRKHTTQGKPAESLRQVLSVDPKLKVDPKTWPYVGFKGGSEDRVLCGNWLLQHKSGKWYTFHAFFNNKAENLKQEEIVKVLQKMFQIFEGEIK